MTHSYNLTDILYEGGFDMSVIREILKKVKDGSVSSDNPSASAISPKEKNTKEPALLKKGEFDMKTKILTALGIIVFMLVLLNTTTVFYFYKQYNDNIDTINQENGITRAKLEDLEKESLVFRNMTETISSQLKSYEQNILTLENRINSNETNANDLSEKILEIKTSINDWQKKLGSALSLVTELRDSTEKLLFDVEEIKKLNTSVDLGKIAVQGRGSKNAQSKKI